MMSNGKLQYLLRLEKGQNKNTTMAAISSQVCLVFWTLQLSCFSSSITPCGICKMSSNYKVLLFFLSAFSESLKVSLGSRYVANNYQRTYQRGKTLSGRQIGRSPGRNASKNKISDVKVNIMVIISK